MYLQVATYSYEFVRVHDQGQSSTEGLQVSPATLLYVGTTYRSTAVHTFESVR